MNHTAGPWEVVPADDDDSWGVTRTGVGGSAIAQMVWYFDAPLIAAAPDMLQALKKTLDYWDATGFSDCDDDCDCVVQSVQAAIARAEGKS